MVCDNIVRFNSNLSEFHSRRNLAWPDHPDNFKKAVVRCGCAGVFEDWVRAAYPTLVSTFDGYIPEQGEINVANFMSRSFVLSKYIKTKGADVVATAVLHYERLRMMFAVTKAVNALISFCVEQQHEGPEEASIISAAGVGTTLQIRSTSPRASLWIDTQCKLQPDTTATAAAMSLTRLISGDCSKDRSSSSGCSSKATGDTCSDAGVNANHVSKLLKASSSSSFVSFDDGTSSNSSRSSSRSSSSESLLPVPVPTDAADGLMLATELCRRGGVAIECACGVQFWCEPVVGYQLHTDHCPAKGVFRPTFHVRGSSRFPLPSHAGSRFQIISVLSPRT